MTAQIDTEEIFSGMVENGLDLLQRAARELATAPKYSVVHFASGVEILLKARLMREHWSLIIERSENADARKFTSGDFKSVGAEQAIHRLAQIAGDRLDDAEKAAILAVQKHRNRVLHHFHDGLSKKASEERVAEIAAEQSRMWYYLERLLTGRWNHFFRSYKRRISSIDKAFKRNRSYLRGKFQAIEASLDEKRCSDCSTCGFPARESGLEGLVTRSSCHVCGATDTSLQVCCTACNESTEFDDPSGSVCFHCDHKITLAELLSPGGAFDSGNDTDCGAAYCMVCEYFGEMTVIPAGDGYLCVSCHSTFHDIDSCGYCSEAIAGSPGSVETYLYGCLLCDGTWSTAKDE